jgi:hypothetical protein
MGKERRKRIRNFFKNVWFYLKKLLVREAKKRADNL